MSENLQLTALAPTPKEDAPPPAVSRILIVDDEQLNLDMLSRRLQRSGFAVSVASTGRSAIAEVESGPYDLVLLDQMMPGMSGSEVLRHWRKQYTPQQLPVVMVTAVAESDKIASALEAGANDYITKPIDYQVALARIRVQLSHKKAEAALRLSEERYALAAQASRDGLWDWDLRTNRVFYSARWLEIMGLTEAPVHSDEKLWFDQILPIDQDEVTSELELIRLGSSDVLHCSYRVLYRDGSLRWMSCRAIATRDASGTLTRLAGSQSDVTEEKTRDALTGLANRTLLLSYLDLACTTGSTSHAVLFIDLDKFKVVNDSLGHMAGDELLRQVSARLEEVSTRYAPAGSDPICARMGGDEFAILLRTNATPASTKALVDSLQATMKSPFPLEGRQLHCAFSIGVAYYSPGQTDSSDLLREADAALYAAKAQGRGCVVVFDPSLFVLAHERFELENDLRGAIERNEMEVFYQAKADIKTCNLYGVEALIRWRHPVRGLIAPGMFIPIAEENGTIVEIGQWVLRQACTQVKKWHMESPGAPPLELSVNLSPREFRQENLLKSIAQTLEVTEFPPSSLHLEITEGVLFEDIDAAVEQLKQLKQLGLRLDLDDFGSGYSSFRYLRQMPFDLIKIDREFTLGLDPDEPSSEHLIQTIVSMGATLGMKVLAEGIETEPHRATLQRLGCKLGQGFFFSRPITAVAMKTLLDGNTSASIEDAA